MATLAIDNAVSRRSLMTVLFIGVFMSALDAAIIAPLVPTLRSALALDNSQVGLVTIIFTLASLTSTTLMASLSDRHGRRRIYLLNVFGFALGSLLIAVSGNLTMLLIGRAIQGFCAGGITPTASAVIGDVFAPAERGKALGLIGATFGMAFLVGPVVASLILAFAGWQWVFLINVPVALLVIWLGRSVLPQQTRPAAAGERFDWAGLALLVTVLISMTLAVNQVLDRALGLTVWPWLVLLMGSGLAVLVAVEGRAAGALLPPRLFLKRQLATIYALAVGAGSGMSSVIFLSSVAVVSYGIPAAESGFWLLPLVLISSIASVAFGRLLNRIGGRWAMVIGFALLMSGSLMVGWAAAPFWFFIGATLLIGAGIGVVVGGTLRALVLDEVDAGDRGVAQSLVNISISTGSLLVVALLGGISDRIGGSIGLATAYLVLSAIMASALLLSLTLKATASRHS
jgi:MFS family permease